MIEKKNKNKKKKKINFLKIKRPCPQQTLKTKTNCTQRFKHE